ncbi:MAG: hypothetical protein Q8P61_05170 [Candidatus Nanopelagicales bacterium]|nr:hypothetical protein [Candidatus Nanopelagicales bacterium]
MNDHPTPKLRKAQLPQSGYLVLRGLFRGMDREAATRFFDRFPGWQEYGLSGYYAASDQDIDALCS